MSGGGSFKRMQASVQQAGSERTELDLVHGLGCHLRKRQVIPVVTKRLLHLRSCVLDAKRGIPGRGGGGGGVGGGGGCQLVAHQTLRIQARHKDDCTLTCW